MFSPKTILILAALSINSALAAPSPSQAAADSDISKTAVLNSSVITPEDQSMCCYCTGGRPQTETACRVVGFGMCSHGSGDGCGIWVGHDNDINRFAEACRLQNGNLQGCRNDS